MQKFGLIAVVFLAVLFSSIALFAEIPHKEFLSTDFIRSFKNQEYKEALKGAGELLKTHPNDPLILRYRALTLEKLHHPAEAISLYHEILAAHPHDIPARLFLGLASLSKVKVISTRPGERILTAKVSWPQRVSILRSCFFTKQILMCQRPLIGEYIPIFRRCHHWTRASGAIKVGMFIPA